MKLWSVTDKSPIFGVGSAYIIQFHHSVRPRAWFNYFFCHLVQKIANLEHFPVYFLQSLSTGMSSNSTSFFEFQWNECENGEQKLVSSIIRFSKMSLVKRLLIAKCKWNTSVNYIKHKSVMFISSISHEI